MKNLLLTILKMATESSVDGYEFLFTSTVFPDYKYFMKIQDFELFKTKCKDAGVSLSSDNENLVLDSLEVSTIEQFENTLYSDFVDLNDAILKMSIISGNTQVVGSKWVGIDLPEEPKADPEISKAQNVFQSGPSQNDISSLITLAEYDAIVDFLKTIGPDDTEARRNILVSMLLALKELSGTKSTAVDIMFDNLVISMQMAKNVDTLDARRFLSKTMKTYLSISEEV